ncbi:hypothetical protein K502DRAFT_348855 [Neoconidiobolus thromboides FSU 785]|nr:hypothetical protein K502DRAFT_348855 [Neoconidiobolus thromboides FSU 785]
MNPNKPNARRLVKIAPNNMVTSSIRNGSEFSSKLASESDGQYRRIAPNNIFLPPIYNIPVIDQVRCIVRNCNKSYDDNSRLFTHLKAKHILPDNGTCACVCPKCGLEEDQSKEEVKPDILREKDSLPTLSSIMKPNEVEEDNIAEETLNKELNSLKTKEEDEEDPFQYITNIPTGDF